jgi:gamma-tubulin complex component 4
VLQLDAGRAWVGFCAATPTSEQCAHSHSNLSNGFRGGTNNIGVRNVIGIDAIAGHHGKGEEQPLLVQSIISAWEFKESASSFESNSSSNTLSSSSSSLSSSSLNGRNNGTFPSGVSSSSISSHVPTPISALHFGRINPLDKWKNLRLDFAVDAPIDLILTRESLDHYSNLFRFLFSVKQVQFQLQQLWVELNIVDKSIHYFKRNKQSSTSSSLHINQPSSRGGHAAQSGRFAISSSSSISDSNSNSNSNSNSSAHEHSSSSSRGNLDLRMKATKRRIMKVMGLRAQMQFFIDNLQFYLQVDVIDVHFQALIAAISDSSTFEEIQKAHDIFLSSITTQTFQRDRILYATLTDLIQCCKDLCESCLTPTSTLSAVDFDHQSSFSNPSSLSLSSSSSSSMSSSSFDSVTDPDTRFQISETEIADRLSEFQRHSCFLFTILSRKSNAQSSPHLSQLVLRLDYNQFFSELLATLAVFKPQISARINANANASTNANTIAH